MEDNGLFKSLPYLETVFHGCFYQSQRTAHKKEEEENSRGPV